MGLSTKGKGENFAGWVTGGPHSRKRDEQGQPGDVS